ncbi:MAG: hypothetical protein IJY62_01630 [Clostridia bacterium]|nr:hypothetical protein [Clostridia bacterium]
MEKEIIVAIITASGGILAAIIAGIFSLLKKSKEKDSQKIQGNNNIQARGNIHVTGGIDIYEQTDDKRR